MTSTPQPLIVAVDDEADDIFFLRHILQKTALPHRFQPFGNGEAAVMGLTSLIEPLLIVFLGVTVGGIAICMFLPIFKLSELVSGNK